MSAGVKRGRQGAESHGRSKPVQMGMGIMAVQRPIPIGGVATRLTGGVATRLPGASTAITVEATFTHALLLPQAQTPNLLAAAL